MYWKSKSINRPRPRMPDEATQGEVGSSVSGANGPRVPSRSPDLGESRGTKAGPRVLSQLSGRGISRRDPGMNPGHSARARLYQRWERGWLKGPFVVSFVGVWCEGN